MKNINEIKAKTALTKSNLPASDYCINPYTGCLHGCVYCYARFMRRFTGHQEPWGKFLDIKINAVECLEKDIKRAKKGLVLLSSVTDPYQPIERKYGLTRGLLEVLLKYQFPVSILTKSSLVTRDIDLFSKFEEIEVGMTITSTSDAVSTSFEPGASKASERISALTVLREGGINTYAFIGPILPGLSDLEQIFAAIEGKVDFVMAEALNPRCGNWDEILKVVDANYPELKESFEKNTYDSDYWREIKNQIDELCKSHGISLKGFYLHGSSRGNK